MNQITTQIPFRFVSPVIGLLLVLAGGCNGPANPEPVMINTGSVFLQEDQPGQVSLNGAEGAAENADGLIVQNLDMGLYEGTPVGSDGSFDLLLAGMPTERFRLIAFNASGGIATRVITSDGVSPDALPVDEADLGCVTVSPPYLDLGSGPAGEPLYGELTVTSECAAPTTFLSQETFSPYYTAASLLLVQPLEPGAQATVSIVFLAPPGPQETQLLIEPDPAIPGPEQIPLQVVLKAEALP